MSVRGGRIWTQQHPQQEYPPDDVLKAHGYETRKEASRRREVKALMRMKRGL